MSITVRMETLPCSVCGQPQEVADWAEITTIGDPVPCYLPGRLAPCPTPRCGEVCRICRREPGDVHGPHCGPLMVAKVDRPHIITEEDCT